MKKILLAIILTGFMSANATAAWEEGTVRFIQTIGDTVNINLFTNGEYHNYPVNASGDTQKTIIAMALTAQAADRNIMLFELSGTWTSVLLRDQ